MFTRPWRRRQRTTPAEQKDLARELAERLSRELAEQQEKSEQALRKILSQRQTSIRVKRHADFGSLLLCYLLGATVSTITWIILLTR